MLVDVCVDACVDTCLLMPDLATLPSPPSLVAPAHAPRTSCTGVGPAHHLVERGVPVVSANNHVGQHLKDKMLLDDMIITDNIDVSSMNPFARCFLLSATLPISTDGQADVLDCME